MQEYSSVGDHEVIESAEALFRHLYEAHGIEEAGDLDPDLTHVEPWLRRHAELERAARRRRAQGGQADDAGRPAAPAGERPAAGSAASGPSAAGSAASGPSAAGSAASGPSAAGSAASGPSAAGPRDPRVFDQMRLRPTTAAQSRRAQSDQAPQAPSPSPTTRATARTGAPVSQRQGSGYLDPLVGALAAELVRCGHDERAVRRYVRRYVALTPEGGLTGEAGIRASFLDPILAVIAEQLDPTTAGAAPPAPPAAPAGARPAGAARDRRSPEEVQEDLMAIANVFRRRHQDRSAL